jgi:hypothetical protein
MAQRTDHQRGEVGGFQVRPLLLIGLGQGIYTRPEARNTMVFEPQGNSQDSVPGLEIASGQCRLVGHVDIVTRHNGTMAQCRSPQVRQELFTGDWPESIVEGLRIRAVPVSGSD